jgi:indolepyruvate ferredoxin oxidoreductase
MSTSDTTIEDKYVLPQGRVYVSGVQALVRLAIAQSQRDRSGGLKTAGFISGYRGSPLGMFDKALWQAQGHLNRHGIHFQPGLNEDIAATSIWGTQQVALSPHARVDGVFSLWYGKGPGVDRSLDVLKHGNSAGASRFGGVLVVAGDDHNCRSSTLPHQSEQALQAAMIPILNPASLQDYLDFGLFGFALSRFSGCWIGFKAISETVESSAIVEVDPARPEVILPEFAMPPGGLNIRWPDPPLEQESRLNGPRMAAVDAFVYVNGIDRLVINPPRARLGIITAGKAYFDVREAFGKLGISDELAAVLGIRLYKVGLSWPLERKRAHEFADGLDDVLVIEEKRAFIESQLIDILYNLDASRRPSVVGKRDERDAPLLPSDSELAAADVARAIVSRLDRLDAAHPEMMQRLERMRPVTRGAHVTSLPERTPFFCAGCPHNISTTVPEGSRALAGIGCHGMAMLIPNRNTAMGTHMGGEGATWIGQSPFTTEEHVFQNLGDGTFQHSGSLALRAAAISGVNITYKILYNDAVGMTGGQSVEGHPSVEAIAREVLAEGAKKVAVVTDHPQDYGRRSGLPRGVHVHARSELDKVQRQLREIPGLTVLIYDQTCAAELRRRRKRRLESEPERRVFINASVCEDCGDCVRTANCIAIKPIETEFGRKRAIDQSNCNKDYSCLQGFCPSFVTVRGGRMRRHEVAVPVLGNDSIMALAIPPRRAAVGEYSILVTGIGGTGIITVGALLGMAAHLEGKGCTVLDLTGVAQKNGAVMSHVRITSVANQTRAVRIGPKDADLILGCDLVVAASAAALECIDGAKTLAIINSELHSTAQSVVDPELGTNAEPFKRALTAVCSGGALEFINATAATQALLGDAIFANVFLLGFACQRGLLPLSHSSIDRAMELNAVEVAANRHAFQMGRLAAHDRRHFDKLVRSLECQQAPPSGFDAIVVRREEQLCKFQNTSYARRYRNVVDAVREAEQQVADGCSKLSEAVAVNLFKLMAYKDEYEVARLHTDGKFLRQINTELEGDFKMELHLAVPFVSRRDESGRLRKRRYGPWILRLLSLLARLKWLRGTRFDPFSYSAERRAERRLIEEYERVMSELIAGLNRENHGLAVELAEIPQQIRGFGPIKLESIELAKLRAASLLDRFRATTRMPHPAARIR